MDSLQEFRLLLVALSPCGPCKYNISQPVKADILEFDLPQSQSGLSKVLSTQSVGIDLHWAAIIQSMPAYAQSSQQQLRTGNKNENSTKRWKIPIKNMGRTLQQYAIITESEVLVNVLPTLSTTLITEPIHSEPSHLQQLPRTNEMQRPTKDGPRAR